jgi:hypothetical protein
VREALGGGEVDLELDRDLRRREPARPSEMLGQARDPVGLPNIGCETAKSSTRSRSTIRSSILPGVGVSDNYSVYCVLQCDQSQCGGEDGAAEPRAR